MTEPPPAGQSRSVAEADLDRFRSLYERELPFVLGYLRRLGVREADLPDVTHDVFVAVIRGFDRYDASRPFRAWLAGVAYRIAANHRRRGAHREAEPLEEAGDVADVDPGPVERLERSEIARRVLEALDGLREERRDVVVLHDLQGLSMPEIAELVDAPLNTLYSRLRLGRRDLAVALGGRP